MAEVAVAEFDDAEVRRFLQGLNTKLDEVKGRKSRYVGLLSAIVYRDVIQHFEGEQGSEGPWKQWSNSYKAQMQERGKGGNKILQDTGRLRNSFKPTNTKTSSKGITWFNDAQVKSFPYAYAHDTGGPILPKRDFMWLSDDAMEDVVNQTLAFMLDEGL